MKLKIISPSEVSGGNVALLWQDHWVKKDLEAEFLALNYTIVDSQADIDIYLFGTFGKLERKLTAKNKFCWLYSHPVYTETPQWKKFSAQFKHVWTLSPTSFDIISARTETRCTVLMGGTSKEFYPRAHDPYFDIVLMGNASKHERVKIMKELISLRKYRIRIAGGGWNKKLSQDEKALIKLEEYFPNEQYESFYNSGKATFFSGHSDMREYGFIPPRVYDIYASSECLCLCESNPSLNHITKFIPDYTEIDELIFKLDYHMRQQTESNWIKENIRPEMERFSFKNIARQMHKDIQKCCG